VETTARVKSQTHLIVVSLLQDGVLEELVGLELEDQLETRVLDIKVFKTNVNQVTDSLRLGRFI
jgi:hypothetical protein